MNVSVTIRTMGRRGRFRKTFNQVLNQTFHDFEIIVIDGNYTEEKEELCNSGGRAHYFVQGGDGMTNARNEGIRKSNGEIIAVLDDDAWPEKDWLENLLEQYEDPEVGAVGGKIVGPPFSYGGLQKLFLRIFGRSDPYKIKWFGYTSTCPDFYDDKKEPFEVDWLSGPNVSMRREAIKDIGGRFDEEYIMHKSCEQMDPSYSVKKGGWKVILNPNAVVHSNPGGTEETGSAIERQSRDMFYQDGYNMTRFAERNIIEKETDWIPWSLYNIFWFLARSFPWIIRKKSLGPLAIYKGAFDRILD